MNTLVKPFLLAAFSYYLAGKFGLLLAIPPGFASAIWPASGIALAYYLILPRLPVLLGVIVGSFLINLDLSTNGFTSFSTSSYILAACISVGAGLQIIAGGFIFNRSIGQHLHLEKPDEIIKLALFVGPVSCIISPSIGTGTLISLDFLSLGNLTFSWLTWWLGDSLGVVIFTPLALTLLSSNQEFNQSRKLQLLAPSAVIFAAILFLFFASLKAQDEARTKYLQDLAQRYYLRIDENLRISDSKLQAYGAFIRASEKVTFNDFNNFSDTLVGKNRTFQGVGWTEVVNHQQRLAIEQQYQLSGYTDFTFTERAADGTLVPAIERDIYYPVLYIYPLDSNKNAFGFNLGSNSARLEALERAKSEKREIATAPIRLVQTGQDEAAVIVYYPVFTLSNPADTQSIFLGYVSGVFLIEKIVGDVIEQAQAQGLGVNIRDVTNKDQPIKLITSTLTPIQQYSAASFTVPFSAREYEISVFISDQFMLFTKDWTSWIILTSGFFVAALLNSFILMLTGTTANIRHEVARKTKDLLQAKQAAEAASIAKSNFLANMSHEFRTPLNAIIGINEICLRTSLSDEQTDYLKKSQLASKTLLALISQSLDYAKIESGKMELEAIEFSLLEIIEKINAVFSTQAKLQHLDFAISLPETLPEKFIGDPLRLEQILLNLCGNAFKFTEQGSINISFETQSTGSDSIEITIKVKDSGVGISDEQQPHLFESFRQADSTTTRKFGGTGLGLTITKEFVELMKGEISLESNIGKGTCFTVVLPFSIASGSDMISTSVSSDPLLNVEKERLEKQVTNLKPLENLNILVVEDNEVNQLVAKQLFTDQGATVTVAPQGNYALNILKRDTSFDLILLDIQMPGMDGYEVTAHIKAMENAASIIPILAMTANVMSEDIQKCLQAGMDGHVAKPLDIGLATNKIITLLKLDKGDD